MCSVKILPPKEIVDLPLSTPQVPLEPPVAQVPEKWLRLTAPLKGTTLKHSPFSPPRAKVEKPLEVVENIHKPWEFVIAVLTVIPPVAWVSIAGVLGFTSVFALASACNCAHFLAQGDPFFGSMDQMALEELRRQHGQHGGGSQPTSGESQKSPRWFEIEGRHAYMFPEKDVFYWTIEDHPDLGLLSGQIGKCIDIIGNGMLLLRFTEPSPGIPTPILPGREKLNKKNLMEVAKWSDFVAIDRRGSGELLRLFPSLEELSL